MASGWSVVRDEIQAVLEAAPLSLKRVKRGVADFAGQPETEAGYGLFQDGFFIQPVQLQKGNLMERQSKHREMYFEIYTGLSTGADSNVAYDKLTERVETIIEELHDCNRTVPNARIVEMSGAAVYQLDQQSFEQIYVRIPFRVQYHQP